MDERSRIKFNPVTKEIEIEGSEMFVKTYFDKIQGMFYGTQEAVALAPIKDIPAEEENRKAPEEKPVKEKPVKKVRQSKKAPVVAEPVIELPVKKVRPSKRVPKVRKEEKLVKEIKRGGMSKTVLALIQGSPDGITSTELKEKTGLKDRQIWAIISNAKKKGKIKQGKRGVYAGA